MVIITFEKVSKYISKDDILKELDKEYKKNGLGEYKKNDDKIFEKLTKDKGLDKAIENCETMELLNKEGQASKRNPMTKAYKVIEGLKEYLD